MGLDAHQHFWVYDEKQYPWIPKGSPLQRDWMPKDLELEQSKVGLSGSIAVQARQSVDESRWLLNLADHYPSIKGVVGWVDLQSDQVETQLAEMAKHSKFRGVRHVVQDEPDDEFLLRPAFQQGLSKLKAFHLTYDLLLYPKHLPAAVKVVQRFSDQPFVLDHISKPFVKTGVISPWKEHIRELAKSPNVHCKVSGLITEANWSTWQPQDFRPYLDVVFEAFGKDRLMFGSDWPVCLLAGSYPRVYQLVEGYIQQVSETARGRILGENAAKFYRVH